jgi:hypothetical protein
VDFVPGTKNGDFWYDENRLWEEVREAFWKKKFSEKPSYHLIQ